MLAALSAAWKGHCSVDKRASKSAAQRVAMRGPPKAAPMVPQMVATLGKFADFGTVEWSAAWRGTRSVVSMGATTAAPMAAEMVCWKAARWARPKGVWMVAATAPQKDAQTAVQTEPQWAAN